MMEEATNSDVSPRKLKRSETNKSNMDKSPLKSDGGHRNHIPNGTDNSSPEHSVEEEVATKDPIVLITKVPKSSKSKESGKSPIKGVVNTVQESSLSNSPSSSALSKDGFQGFEDSPGKEDRKRRKDFISFVDQLRAEEDEKVSGELSEREEEMTVDAGQTSDADSNQMEIDTSSDRVPDKLKDSDMEAIEADAPDGIKQEAAEIENTEPSSKGSGAKVEYCGGCEAEVNDSEEGICCDGKCERWFHLRCSELTQAEYDELGLDENAKWACSKCSGKPPPVIQAGAKPLLTVRKDLTRPVTPAGGKRKSIVKDGAQRGPRVDISNPAFLKPFDFGWKRELVYRSTTDTTPSNKRQGDIYYYTPKGKKLRSLREIVDHISGSDLTQDNFTFHKEPIGLDDPEKEIIRDAKLKLAMKDPLATPSPKPVKKVVPKITKVTPKVATPKVVTPKSTAPKITPKLTATVSPLDSGGAAVTPKASASVTPRVVFKGGIRVKVPHNKTQTTATLTSKDKKKKPISDGELEMGMLPPMWEPLPKPKENKMATDVCSIRCLPAMGLIPTLQCVVCLCLYHPQCVGLQEEPTHAYKCKNCQMEKAKPTATTNGTKTILLPPPLTPITTAPSQLSPAPPKLQKMSEAKPTPRGKAPQTKNTSLVGGLTTWLPPSSTIHMRSPPPVTKLSPSQKPLPPATAPVIDPSIQPVQTVVGMDGKRYILVPKHNVLSVSPATTSGASSDSVSTQITTAACDSNTNLTTQAYGQILPKTQASPSSAYIVGSPTSPTGNFQKPPGVLLVPYMTPQTSPSQMDGQQPQFIVVNGPTSLTPGNILIGNIPQQQQLTLPTVTTSQLAESSLE